MGFNPSSPFSPIADKWERGVLEQQEFMVLATDVNNPLGKGSYTLLEKRMEDYWEMFLLLCNIYQLGFRVLLQFLFIKSKGLFIGLLFLQTLSFLFAHGVNLVSLY